MKLAAALLPILAVAGCTKDRAESAAPAAPPIARPNDWTLASAQPGAAGPPLSAPTAARSDHAEATANKAEADSKMSCGNAEMADGTCAGAEGEAKGCSQWDEAAAAVGRREVPSDAEWATIPVEGMTCGGCERRIIASLGSAPGIVGVEADAELGQVRVAFARGSKGPTEDARARIAALGYRPK
jgi:copper chaperone CopZ